MDRAVKPAGTQIFVAACGQFFAGECVIASQDSKSLDSKVFCGKCLAFQQKKPAR
jgi:hypothetical protein